MTKDTIIIDASNSVVGRIASYAAKKSLLGRKVIIVNCERALLTGRRGSIIKEYHVLRNKGGSSLKGPFFSRSIERIMKRTIRGMLNYHQKRGLDAFKRIICYSKVPEEYESTEKITLSTSEKSKAITLQELSKNI